MARDAAAARPLRRRSARAQIAMFLLYALVALAAAPLKAEGAVASGSGSALSSSQELPVARYVPSTNFAKYDGRQVRSTQGRDGMALGRRHEGHHDEEDLGEEETMTSMSHHTESAAHKHEHEDMSMGDAVLGAASASSQVSQSASQSTATASAATAASSFMPVHSHHDHKVETANQPPHSDATTHSHADDTSDSHSHSHKHSSHDSHNHHKHAPHPYDGVPDASVAGAMFITVPPLAAGAGGHNHGHGNEAPAMDLNETTILRGKGPDPLSYIEWDFAYGIGKADELERFAKAYKGDYHNVMGVAGGRWRTLLDELNNSTRKAVAKDIRSRVHANKEDPGRHPMLMILHVVGCIVSCFIMLPVALALRAAHSNLAPAASLIYLVTLAASLAVSWLYKMVTPQLYPKHSHSGLGYAIFWLSLLALGADVFRLVAQLWSVVKSTRGTTASQRLGAAMRALTARNSRRAQTDRLTRDAYDPEEEERMLSDDGAVSSDAQEIRSPRLLRTLMRQNSDSSSPPRSVHFEDDGQQQAHSHTQHEAPAARQARNEQIVNSWRNLARSRSGDHLPSPTSTLCNTPRNSVLGELQADGQQAAWKLPSEGSSPAWKHEAVSQSTPKHRRHPMQIIKSIVRYSHVTLARSLPVLSFAAAYTGLTVYTGSCRGPYKNVCLAHGIKGGVFFWYGLLTFGRYMGAYADMGWAWNRRPGHKNGKHVVSAEWVECLVILIYGATNTWMERFGAKSGDPYTVKQVQHISIAVMFWFAGLLGLFLETPSLKSLLSIPVAIKHNKLRSRSRSSAPHQVGATSADALVGDLTPPPSYSFSFNPFPALVIGVTGVAMAAHHQDYVYEVSIHALWGNLLAGFSVLRMLTYFFLWLRPPTSSIMPSRPPTEALASFSLACGGFVFMLSSEEVSFVAMRNGFGDFMMILNVTVALVSLLFCWVAGLMVIKAWAVRREHRRDEQHHEDGAIRLHDAQSARGSAVQPSTESANARDTTQASSDSHAVFVLDDEEALERHHDEKRQFSSSPLQA